MVLAVVILMFFFSHFIPGVEVNLGKFIVIVIENDCVNDVISQDGSLYLGLWFCSC